MSIPEVLWTCVWVVGCVAVAIGAVAGREPK